LVTFSPVDRVRRQVIPASTPTTAVDGGAPWTLASTRIDTWYWPRAFRDTVTCDGSVPSGNGLDHTMFNGRSCLARVTFPSRKVKHPRK
jgi:hypothetical protein